MSKVITFPKHSEGVSALHSKSGRTKYSPSGVEDALPIAYGYCRVSTKMQVEDGSSLESQADRIRKYCEYKKYRLNKIYHDDGISGASLSRPQLHECIEKLQEGNIFIVAELSRLSRSMQHAIILLQAINEKGAKLISLSPDIDFSTPQGEMMFNVLVAFYQLERRQISERVSNTMQYLVEQGTLRGRPPYGWRFVSKEKGFEEVPEQQEVIKKVEKMFEKNKDMTNQGCANYLNRKGYNKTLNINKNTKKDQVFYSETIKRIRRDIDLMKSECFRYIEGRKKK